MSTENNREVWYNKSVEQIEKHFATDRGTGLTSQKAAAALKKQGANIIYKTSRSPRFSKLIPTDFTSVLLIAAVLIARVFGVPIAASAIIGMLLINYSVTLFTYFKALKVLDGMTEYSLPTAKVLRDGRPRLIDMRALVPGDVIFLSGGDIVPADCRLFMSEGLYINEAAVTSVQSSVSKDARFENYSHNIPLDKMENMAFASSIVTAGNGRAIVVATGADTEVCTLGKAKPITTHEDLKILASLRKYCSVWSICMLLLVFAVTVISLVAGAKSGLFDVFLTGVSLAAAAMSEFYLAFGYIIVGCGIFAAMKRRRDVNEGAIIKNARKLEELKNITTLIIPKDGIVTSQFSFVEKIYTSRTLYSITDNDRAEKMRATVLCGVISTGIYGAGLAVLSDNSRRISPEEEAIIAAAEEMGLYNSSIDSMYPIIQHMSAGGSSKFETTLTKDTDNRYMAVCRGDAETLLNACEYYTENGRVLRMTTEDRLEFMGAAASLAKNSYRVCAVATGVSGYNNLQRIGAIQSDLTFEGFIAVREPLQPGIAETVERCRKAGIRVIMTTEKYAENDKYLAMSIGVVDNEKGILTANKYDSMRPEMLRTDLPLFGMYAGLSSKRISHLVKLLREDGERVGLLAGGMDGAILLKRADVGFARSTTISPKARRSGIDISSRRMGAYSSISGRGSFESEALKYISDVVVSDAAGSGKGGFSAVVSAMEYSRSIYKNLLRMVTYLTTSQLSRVLITLGAILLGFTALTPVQLVFSGLVIDLAAIVASAFSRPPHSSLFLKDNAEAAFTKPLYMNLRASLFAAFEAALILVMNPMLTRSGAVFTSEQYVSAAFIGFIVCRFVTFLELATERSLFRSGLRMSISFALFLLLAAGFVCAALLLPSFGAMFGVVKLTGELYAAVFVLGLLVLAVHEIFKLIIRQDSSGKGTPN